MRRSALLIAAVAVALCAAAPGAAQANDVAVGIPAKYFVPSQLQVVVGDTVRWSNSDHDTHNLVADDGEFDSGFLGTGGSFSHTFTAVGDHPYICTIHQYMTGEVDAVPIALAGPEAPPTEGERFTLTGRAPAGVASVQLERAATKDGPFAPAGLTATTSADGSFTATITADSTAAWRAVDGDRASPPVTVSVAPKLDISVKARLTRSLIVLSVATKPLRPGEVLALQLYSRERFAWLPAGRAVLDDEGRIEFSLRRGVRRLARVVYEKEGAVVRSQVLALWRVGSGNAEVKPKPAPKPKPAAPAHGH
jgi:plastocyanin